MKSELSLIDAPVRSAMTKDVKTIDATKTVADGIKMMRDANIGSLVVVGKDHSPVGIFTERDFVRRMAEKGHGFLALPMAQVMTKPLTIISPVATIWDAVTLMGRADIRRLPVVENGHLIGILTERDVFRLIWPSNTYSWNRCRSPFRQPQGSNSGGSPDASALGVLRPSCHVIRRLGAPYPSEPCQSEVVAARDQR